MLQGEGPSKVGGWTASWGSRGRTGGRCDDANSGRQGLELTKLHSPAHQRDNRYAPANTPGVRHVAFAVEDIDAVVARLRARGAELVGELERY